MNRVWSLLSSSSSSSSEEEPEIYIRRRKKYSKRKIGFESYDDVEFFDRFHLTKPTTLALLEKIEHLIKLPTNRGGSVSPVVQLLVTLRFYATGSMLVAVEDFPGVSKASASRIVKRVSEAIASLCPQYVKMYKNQTEMQEMAEKFSRVANFPRVIGAIYSTPVRIQSPGGEDAEIFRCRKGFFSLKVQTVCDADLKIRNIVARWPGSVHDQTIFNNSRLKYDCDRGMYGRFLLVGNGGYSLQPYLMKKLTKTNTRAENLYNESVIRIRNVGERQYRVWQCRFPILSTGIRLKLETVMTVIVATAVVHNIAIEMNDNFPDEWIQGDIIDENAQNNNHNQLQQLSGKQTRQLIINNHFGQL